MSEKVLFVDDDPNILAAYKRQLRRQFDIRTACGGAEALAAIKAEGPFAVVVSDMQMPEMNGLQFLREATKLAPETVRMMLTGNADQKTAVDAVNKGHIFRFHTKPFPPEEMAAAVEAGLAQYRLVTAERELLERTLAGSVKVLIDVLSLADPEAFGRTRRLRDWMQAVAAELGLSQAWELNLAAMLAPIGQLTVPAEIRRKLRGGEALSAAERDVVAGTPEAARNLIANIPRLDTVSRIIYYQGKGYDGSGFPKDQVAGEQIPLPARILRVLNDLDPLVSGKTPTPAAIARLERTPGLYDPRVLAAVRSCFGAAGDEAGQEVQETIEAVGVGRLLAGDRLAEDIEAANGDLVLSADHEISPALVEKLRNLHKTLGLKEPIRVYRAIRAGPEQAAG